MRRETIPVTDLGASYLAPYISLNEAQLYHYHEPAPGVFIAETPNVIGRALDAGYVPVSMLCEDALTGAAADMLMPYPEAPVYSGPLRVLKQITGYSLTHGMLCCMRRRPLPDAEELLGKCTGRAGRTRIAVLEEVMNPTNAGAVFRSAAALGLDAVLLTKGCADPLQRRCSRVSMGTVYQIPWTFLPEDWIRLLAGSGWKTAAMALEERSISISDPALKSADKLAIVLGTEGYGLKKETIEACDYTVLIPMMRGVDSLNVAAAGAVAFWELCGRP